MEAYLLHIFISLITVVLLFIMYRSYFPVAYRNARRSKRRYIIRETDKVTGEITHLACTHETMKLFVVLDKQEDYPFSFKVIKSTEDAPR